MITITQKGYKRLDGESDDELIYRIASDKDLIGSWQDVADIINQLLGCDYNESTYRKKYQSFASMLSANQARFVDSDTQIEDIRLARRELEKERKKLQTEKLEYNQWLREEARDEMIMENICDAVKQLQPLQMPDFIPPIESPKGYVLTFGDEHYGVEFEIRGLANEVLNAYSPEIFEQRMHKLLNATIDLIHKEGITELHVFNMGDEVDGCLRVSQLMKLRYGVVDSVVRYADFISNWINALSEHVRVIWQMTAGNHSELRMLSQPKGTFTEDNMDKVIRAIIKARLEGNPNFEFRENPTGLIYEEVASNTILGIHGEVSNMASALKDFSQIYNKNIKYLLAGHKHHSHTEEVGINSEIINVPSVIGVDEYSLKLRKMANAGAKMLVFDEENGLVCEYRIKLN